MPDLLRLAADLRYLGFRQEIRKCDAPERDHDVGLNQPYLLVDPGRVRAHFGGSRRTVFWRAASDDVRDENVVTRDLVFDEQLVQEFARIADKGTARFIFLLTRRLAYKHEGSVRRTNAEYNLRPANRQFALRTAYHGVEELLECARPRDFDRKAGDERARIIFAAPARLALWFTWHVPLFHINKHKLWKRSGPA